MPDDPKADKPKIIVDEDWKSQVQAEKRRLAEELQQKEAATTPAAEPPATDWSAEEETDALTPASFPVLLSMLATQAMVCLGQIPSPLSGQLEVHLDEAKHFIDLLSLLEDKTRGNLTEQESQMLEALLHELRMSFVMTTNRAK